MRAAHVYSSLFLAALVGCGGGADKSGAGPAAKSGPPVKSEPAAKSGPAPKSGSTPTKPQASADRFTRANFHRVRSGVTLAEVEKIFGPPDTRQEQGSDAAELTWGPKERQLWVAVRKGIVQGASWPGLVEHDTRLMRARENLHGLAMMLEDHALRHGSRLPKSFAEVKSKRTPSAELPGLVASGEIVVPWGETANQMIWAWWKDTPETGGPYIRYDLTIARDATPTEFAKLKGVKLTVKTIPAEHAKPSLQAKEGEPGFFLSTTFMTPLGPCIDDPKVPAPKSLDDYPVFMVRDDLMYEGLRAIEAGEIVVRWDRHPGRGLYMYPKNFRTHGGWAVVDGRFNVYTLAEALKLLAKE